MKNNGIITPAEYIGKSVADAAEKAKNDGFVVRIVEENGKSFMVTADYKTNRINFRVNNGKVIGVHGG